MTNRECCVLIPSLEPDEKLPQYVKKLLAADFGMILVIDDGSGPSYQPIFEDIAGWKRCTVLHHEVNRGKGAALRTGYSHILEKTAIKGVITADSDGQHTVEDTTLLAERLTDDQEELLLGSRDFSRRSKQVPPKSRFGNRLTSAIFGLLYGHFLPDTQTGLRGMNRQMLNDCLKITGDRFEYEMNQLMFCAMNHIPMVVVPIKTVYMNENQGTHFHPIRDSWRIYKLILGNFFRYMSTSILSFLVDYLLFMLLSMWLLPKWISPEAECIIIFWTINLVTATAQAAARVISSVFNYTLNNRFVFTGDKAKGSWWRYAVLTVLVLIVSSVLIGGLSHLFGLKGDSFLNTLIKVVVDTVIYFINYRIQRNWVFKPANK